MSNKSKTFEVLRHVRDAADDGVSISNIGGVTLFFHIDLTNGTMLVSSSVCSENFNTTIGRKIAEGRMKAGQAVRLVYNPDQSLVDNTISGLESLCLADELWITTLLKLQKYTRNLPRQKIPSVKKIKPQTLGNINLMSRG